MLTWLAVSLLSTVAALLRLASHWLQFTRLYWRCIGYKTHRIQICGSRTPALSVGNYLRLITAIFNGLLSQFSLADLGVVSKRQGSNPPASPLSKLARL